MKPSNDFETEAPKVSAKKPILFSQKSAVQRFSGNTVDKTKLINTRLSPVTKVPKKTVPSSNRPNSSSAKFNINMRQRPTTAPVKKPAQITATTNRSCSATAPVKRPGTATTHA